MSLKIVRNDIAKMNTEAIVNTANNKVATGDVFITPGFNVAAKYIIHAVSPFFSDGDDNEEELLRSCYRKSLALAKENNIKSIAFPLIATGGYGYPKEEGMRIAIDEINAFLFKNDMEVFLVVFDSLATDLGRRVDTKLEAYIDENYVSKKQDEEYELDYFVPYASSARTFASEPKEYKASNACVTEAAMFSDDAIDALKSGISKRLEHITDTYSQYLLYLIKEKGMENADVYKRAIVDKKTFSKIKNNPDYHPQKMTALCLCIGAKLNLDETKDLLARAGYALSPCDKTDIIFSYFIENEIYDMIELDIQLEEHGLPCVIV